MEPEKTPKDFYSFEKLMPHRINEVLLAASMYDSFLFADDESLDEALLSHMTDPRQKEEARIVRARNTEETFDRLKNKKFDIIIAMIQVGEMDMDSFISRIKQLSPETPVILLSFNMQDILNISDYVKKSTDGIFLWQGDTRIFSAIIHLVEDKKNFELDSAEGVQAVLLVEDNIRFYSVYLPIIYSELMKQTQIVMADELNPLKKSLRLKARPKILLSKNYEDAWAVYNAYKNNLLGVITDIEYPRNGKCQPEAGIILAERIKKENPDMPVLLQSSNPGYAGKAQNIGTSFLNKNSSDLSKQLRNFIQRYFGFGDFIFSDDFGQEIARASDLQTMLKILKTIPAKSIIYHASRNHFSKWLFARTEFETAYHIRPKKISEFKDGEEIRKYLIETIHQFIYRTQLGSVLKFNRRLYDVSTPFVKIGAGSIGGKARGLAFMDFLISKNIIPEKIDGVKITTPNSVVLSTDVFDFFMEQNDLESVINDNYEDERIADIFSKIKLPDYAVKDLMVVLEKFSGPLAVRSSSILEDSKTHPFAGIYKTYMLKNTGKDIPSRFGELEKAIKFIYASVFSREARAFRKMTPNVLDEEKMAIVIQKIVGREYVKDRHYPLISGVLQSYNYYPVLPLRSFDPVAHICVGLGESVVSGFNALRFSPNFPENLHQFSTVENTILNSQKKILCVDLAGQERNGIGYCDDSDIKQIAADELENSPGFEFLASTYSSEEERLYDSVHAGGIKLITFAPVLKNETLPLNRILRELSSITSDAMGSNIEMEFALDYDPQNGETEFNVLQIRPMSSKSAVKKVNFNNTENKTTIFSSESALGNGYITDIRDIVYVKPENFSNLKTDGISAEINEMNERLKQLKSGYALLGPGRWGSSDVHLGIPVKWNNISFSKIIIEAKYADFWVDPSYGTHFFHNVTSLGIGYLTMLGQNDFINWDWLRKQKKNFETEHVAHIRLERNLDIRIDGNSSKALVFY